MEIKLNNNGQTIVIDNNHLNDYEHIDITIIEDENITKADCVCLDDLLSALEAFKKQRDLDRIRESFMQ